MVKGASFSGLSFFFDEKPEKPSVCLFCRRGDLPLLYTEESKISHVGVCEPCASLLGWAWRSVVDNQTPISVVRSKPEIVQVLAMRPREGDLIVPYDVIAREGLLPSDKVDSRKPEERAVDVLNEISIKSWVGAMEPLHVGFDFRGRLTATFLCIAYYFEDEFDGRYTWNEWPLSKKREELGGHHLGIELAFRERLKLQHESSSKIPLSSPLSLPAYNTLETRLKYISGDMPDGKEKLVTAYMSVISGEEKGSVSIVFNNEKRLRGIVDKPKALIPTEPEKEDEEETEGEEVEGEDDDNKP
jgi:hypothetical protein